MSYAAIEELCRLERALTMRERGRLVRPLDGLRRCRVDGINGRTFQAMTAEEKLLEWVASAWLRCGKAGA
jgi:hypothetical protein